MQVEEERGEFYESLFSMSGLKPFWYWFGFSPVVRIPTTRTSPSARDTSGSGPDAFTISALETQPRLTKISPFSVTRGVTKK